MAEELLKVGLELPNGTAEPFQSDANKNVKVRNAGGLTSTRSDFRIGKLDPTENEYYFLTVEKESVIQKLQFMFDRDDADVFVRLEFWRVLDAGEESHWSSYPVLLSTTSATTNIRPGVLEHDNLFIAIDNNVYLQNPLHVKSFRIRLENRKNEPVNLSCSVLWSEV